MNICSFFLKLKKKCKDFSVEIIRLKDLVKQLLKKSKCYNEYLIHKLSFFFVFNLCLVVIQYSSQTVTAAQLSSCLQKKKKLVRVTEKLV